MVEWLDLREGNTAMEPSAGHGAIAMWFPESASITAIEPSYPLFAKLNARAGGGNRRILNQQFEDLDVINKFDGIAMNPPFGSGGKMAMDHIEKAFKHLKERGRIVAIIPDGGSMNKRFEQFMYGTDENGKAINPNAHLIASIKLPRVTFEQAGTQVSVRVVIIDKITTKTKLQVQNDVKEEQLYKILNGRGSRLLSNLEVEQEVERRYNDQFSAIPQTIEREITDVDKIDDFFDRIEFLEVPDRAVEKKEEVSTTPTIGTATKSDVPYELVNTRHTQTGAPLHYVKLKERVSSDAYTQINAVAKKYGGFWDKFAKSFRFETPEKRQSFVSEAFKNDISLLNEKAEEYIAKNQVYSQTKPEDDFPEGVSFISERASGELSGQLDLFGEGDYTASPDDGSVTYSERILSDKGHMEFMGDKLSGPAEIKSSKDIAFLFKNLESSATENAFAVLMDDSGAYLSLIHI
jgi:predicted RNA methylase